MIKAGDTLTIDGTMLSISGMITFEKGDKVIVEEAFYTEGYWSRLCPDIYIKSKLSHVKLVGQYGHWLPTAFVETKNIK